jgi:hypothetical protein
MSRQVLLNTVTSFDNIHCLTLTGGEPSLAVSVIEELCYLCQWRDVKFDYFYVVTNGKTRNGWRKFLAAMDKLHALAGEPSECTLTLSQDQFHRECHDTAAAQRKFWNEYADYPEYFRPDERKRDIPEPINEGRAMVNGIGWKEPTVLKPWLLNEEDYVDGTVYVAANGNVVSDCDMSFKRIDAESKGNVLTTCIADIIRSYSVKLEEEAVA